MTAFIPLGRPFFLFLLFHFSPHSDRKRLFFRRFSATNPGRNGGVATLPKKRLDDAYHVHVWDRFFVFFVGQEIRRSRRRSWSTEMAPLPSGGLEWPTNATPARRFFSVFCRFLFCFSKWRRPLAEPSTPGSRFVFVLSSRFYRRQNENDHTEPPTSSSSSSSSSAAAVLVKVVGTKNKTTTTATKTATTTTACRKWRSLQSLRPEP